MGRTPDARIVAVMLDERGVVAVSSAPKESMPPNLVVKTAKITDWS